MGLKWNLVAFLIFFLIHICKSYHQKIFVQISSRKLPGWEERGCDDHGDVVFGHLVDVLAGHDLAHQPQQLAQRGALLGRQQQHQQVQGAPLGRATQG